MFAANMVPALSAAATPYWLSKMADSAADGSFPALGVDGSGNIYVVADQTFYKFNAAGTLQWQRSITTVSGGTFTRLAVTSAGDIYAITEQQSGGGLIVRIDTSGSLQWQKIYSLWAAGTGSAQGVCVDSAGLPYFLFGNGLSGFVVKMTAAGAITWQRKITGTGGSNNTPDGLACDGTNVWALVSDGVSNVGTLVKYNGSGTVLLQRDIPGAVNYGYSNLTCDTSGNVYVVFGVSLQKLNSSGVTQWQRNATSNYTGCAVDNTTGDVYAAGFIAVSSVTRTMLHKYASNGATTWQRSIKAATGTASACYALNPLLHTSGDLLIAPSFSYPGNAGASQWRLPVDGTKTGTYAGLQYASDTITITTTAATAVAGTATLATPSGTVSNDSQTYSTPTNVQTRTPIP